MRIERNEQGQQTKVYTEEDIPSIDTSKSYVGFPLPPGVVYCHITQTIHGTIPKIEPCDPIVVTA